jgi:hypothetical protein
MPRYDIHFQPIMPPEDQYGFKSFTFGFVASLKIRGPQSLVNRWVKTFMTPKGSDLLHPSYGTDFGSLAGSNIVNDFSTLQDTVIMSIDDASDQVRRQDEAETLDDDESLESAELGSFVPEPGGDGFNVWVVINNKAGQNLPTKLTLMASR